MQVAANLGFLFTDRPWTERPAAAAAAGLHAVEFPWPPDPAPLATAVAAAGVGVALVNMPAGDLAAGERGHGNDPARVEQWRGDFERALAYASGISRQAPPLVNVLAGNRRPGLPVEAQRECLVDNLRWAAPRAAAAGTRLVVEPINSLDIPEYLCPRTTDVTAVLDQVGEPGIGVQLDTYHCAAMGEDPAATVAALGPRLGHVQLADHPGRHEPGSGDLDIAAILATLRDSGYAGSLGLEYVPLLQSAASVTEVIDRWGNAT
ncbi:MAG: hydroxypyruvate isomerase family protein [Micromonosporaceae bacterium]